MPSSQGAVTAGTKADICSGQKHAIERNYMYEQIDEQWPSIR